MTGRYEIQDTHHPEWRGMRFTSLERAERELARAVPAGRFIIVDRQTKSRPRPDYEPRVDHPERYTEGPI